MDINNLNEPVDLAPGEWIGDIPEFEGAEFLVRSTNFRPFLVATGGLARRSGKKIATDEGLADFTVSAGKPLAEHILLGWRGDIGLTENGKPLKYSKESAIKILTADDAYGVGRKWRRAVEWAGDQVADKLLTATKEAEGN